MRRSDICLYLGPADRALGAPNKLVRRVAVGGQSFKLSTVGGAKVKADVGASHARNVAHQAPDGNPMSGVEH